jgi:hypothetical protein
LRKNKNNLDHFIKLALTSGDDDNIDILQELFWQKHLVQEKEKVYKFGKQDVDFLLSIDSSDRKSCNKNANKNLAKCFSLMDEKCREYFIDKLIELDRVEFSSSVNTTAIVMAAKVEKISLIISVKLTKVVRIYFSTSI